MVSAPVVLFAEEPTDTLRALVLAGIRKLLGMPEAPRAPSEPAGAHRGRKSVMTPRLQQKAQRLRDRGESPDAIGVSRATVYRFLRR